MATNPNPNAPKGAPKPVAAAAKPAAARPAAAAARPAAAPVKAATAAPTKAAAAPAKAAAPKAAAPAGAVPAKTAPAASRPAATAAAAAPKAGATRPAAAAPAAKVAPAAAAPKAAPAATAPKAAAPAKGPAARTTPAAATVAKPTTVAGGTKAAQPARTARAAAPAQATLQATAAAKKPAISPSNVPKDRPKIKPRTQRNVQRANQTGKPGIPRDDHTVKSDVDGRPFNLVRPRYNGGSLIFRPLPTWNRELASQGDWQVDAYRTSAEQTAFSDFYRVYPAAFYVGAKDMETSFLLYDTDWGETEYDKRSNPYLLLYYGIYRASSPKSNDFCKPWWAPVIDGRNKLLSRPADVYYFCGIVFKRGKEVYLGSKGPPKGLGSDDLPQIIQLKNSAGAGIVRQLNLLNDDWAGDPEDYEHSMLHGDPVGLDNGRFITVYNPAEEKLGGEDLSQVADYGAGQRRRGDANNSDDNDARGYDVLISKHMSVDGKELTRLPASLTGAARETALARILCLEDVINLPAIPTPEAIEEMHRSQCMLLARAFQGYRSMLEYAWQDYPEYLSADVMKVLNATVQVTLAGMPTEADGGQYGDPDQLAEDAESYMDDEMPALEETTDDSEYQEMDPETGEPLYTEEVLEDDEVAEGEEVVDEEPPLEGEETEYQEGDGEETTEEVLEDEPVTEEEVEYMDEAPPEEEYTDELPAEELPAGDDAEYEQPVEEEMPPPEAEAEELAAQAAVAAAKKRAGKRK